MIKLFINGHAASAGGGLTYLRNLIPQMASREDVEVKVLLSHVLRREFGSFHNVSFIEAPNYRSALRRFFYEQVKIPELVRQSGAKVLISTGNFALWKSPVPQILLSRNSLYTSADFMRDVRARGDFTIWADTLAKGWFARRSIRRADVTVAPSEAFAADLTQWSGRKVIAVHHGFDADAFTRDLTPLPAEVQARVDEGKAALRLLFVSHYNYYRNFETLVRAIPILKTSLNGHAVKLFLTCRLTPNANPGSYKTDTASSLANDLRAGHDIVELGAIPYHSLHHLYRACHIYVTPAYAESFAHPLVEAMSSGLPVVASDLPVHREICQDAALYFPRFSPEQLAAAIARLHTDPALAANLSQAGRARAKAFTWEENVTQLLRLATELARRGALS